MGAMDPRISAAYEACRRLQLRHDPTYYWATRRLPADVRPATHALYGYVRTADQIVDGPRRPPTPAARRAALDAWEEELHAAAARLVAPGRWARWWTPASGTTCRSTSSASTCARCASTAGRCGSAATTSSTSTWTARPARSAGSWPRCSACPSATTPTSGTSARRSSSRTSSATCARTGGWTASTCRPRLRRRRDLGTRARDAAALRAVVAQQVARARALFAAAEPAVAAAPASVRSGIRLACAAYGRILDRAEAAGGDVLGRRDRRAGARPAAPAGGGPAMTRRATLRGAERTPLEERADVLVCGASFAGLAVARELAGSGADVLVVDRYEIGERATSACAAPTPWLHAMGVERSIRQELPVHGLPHAARLGALPAAVELVELRLPRAVRGAVGAVRRAVRDREGRAPRRRDGPHRSRRR